MTIVQKYGTMRQRVRVTLYQIYHHALHNRVREARDLLFKTQMASLIIQPQQTVDNQILYNRALIQVGLGSFRLGKIKEASDLLTDIC